MTKIEKLSRDWYILKNGLTHRKDELTYHTFDDIKPPRPAMDFHPDNMKNLQPRNVSEYQDLITQIQFLIDKAIEDGRPTTEGAELLAPQAKQPKRALRFVDQPSIP